MTHEAKKTRPDTVLMIEFFNTFHMNMYRKLVNGNLTNLHTYVPGAFYTSFDLNNNQITKSNIYSERHRNVQAEEQYRTSLLLEHDFDKFPIVMHNHVLPINPEVYRILYDRADNNIFIHRESLIDQLSSYAVAYHTKVFAEFPNGTRIQNISNITIADGVLEYLVERINHWHTIDKSLDTIVKYEDIDFSVKVPNTFPIKQNITCAFDCLSLDTQNRILSLNEDWLTYK